MISRDKEHWSHHSVHEASISLSVHHPRADQPPLLDRQSLGSPVTAAGRNIGDSSTTGRTRRGWSSAAERRSADESLLSAASNTSRSGWNTGGNCPTEQTPQQVPFQTPNKCWAELFRCRICSQPLYPNMGMRHKVVRGLGAFRTEDPRPNIHRDDTISGREVAAL